jgi:hypothetical protein
MIIKSFNLENVPKMILYTNKILSNEIIINSNSNIREKFYMENNYIFVNYFLFTNLIKEFKLTGNISILNTKNNNLKNLNITSDFYTNNEILLSILSDVLDFTVCLFIFNYNLISFNKEILNYIENYINKNAISNSYNIKTYPFNYFDNENNNQSYSLPQFKLNSKNSENLFKGIAIDAKENFNLDLNTNEIFSIINMYYCSIKIICDYDFLTNFVSKSKLYKKLPSENNNDGILTYTFPNKFKLYLSYRINFLNKNYYIFSCWNTKNLEFNDIISNNLKKYLNFMFSYSYDEILLNYFKLQ